MANMSFTLTIDQIRAQSKKVTRRKGWRNLKAGDVLQPVERCMGIPKGFRAVPIGPPIRVVSVRREPLDRIIRDKAYGLSEVNAEGFPGLEPQALVQLILNANKKMSTQDDVTRMREKPRRSGRGQERVQRSRTSVFGLI